MPIVKRLWLMNTETHLITHMAEVEGPQGHQDFQPNGIKKRQWKYLQPKKMSIISIFSSLCVPKQNSLYPQSWFILMRVPLVNIVDKDWIRMYLEGIVQ